MSKISPGCALIAGQRLPNLRQWPRYPITARCDAVEPLAGRHLGGSVIVISLGGCYIRTPYTLHAGAVLQLRIEWHETVFEAWGRVVHAISGDGMGMVFFGAAQEQMSLLKQWIAELAQPVAKP